MREEGLPERAQRLGGQASQALRALQAKHPEISEVRGPGLLIGIEFGERLDDHRQHHRAPLQAVVDERREVVVAHRLEDLDLGHPLLRGAVERGLDVDEFAPRLSFFFNAHLDFFEEIAKYRAARRIWARELRDTYGATRPEAMRMRFHTQTAGVSLTAQQQLAEAGRQRAAGREVEVGLRWQLARLEDEVKELRSRREMARVWLKDWVSGSTEALEELFVETGVDIEQLLSLMQVWLYR